MDVNEDNTLHLDTNLGKRTTILLHLQMFMNVSIWLKLAVIICYGPTPSGRIWLEVIARWTLTYESAKQHIKTARKGLLRFFHFLFHRLIVKVHLVMVSNWNCQMLRGFGGGRRSVSQHLILCKFWLYILPVWLNQLYRSEDGQNNLKIYYME